MTSSTLSLIHILPEKYRNSDILESLFAHRNFMHYLHLIPSSSWNNGTVRDAIYSLYRDVQQNGGYRYCSERYEQQFLYETSVMLSLVPRQAKDFSCLLYTSRCV